MMDDEATETEMKRAANAALKGSAVAWFLVAVAGQWLFVAYILAFYGARVFSKGADDSGMPGGFVAGDTAGNTAVAAHLLLAVIVIGGGPLQLVPQIRARWPTFHRWNGRIYMPAALVGAASGFYLSLARNPATNVIDAFSKAGVAINAVLIVFFAAIAFRSAVTRRIGSHRRWALRLYLAVNGVWFFRIGLMLWFYLTGGVGIDTETFTGPALLFLNYAQYLLPLGVLQLYLAARDHAGPGGRFATAALLVLLTVATALGIWRAYVGLWAPRM